MRTLLTAIGAAITGGGLLSGGYAMHSTPAAGSATSVNEPRC